MRDYFQFNKLDPAKELNSLTPFERFTCGLGALSSSVAAAFFGAGLIDGAVNGKVHWTITCTGLGGGLLAVSAFMFLVWMRLWFGGRPWLDAAINNLFWKVYFYLPLGILVLCVWGQLVLLRE